jgi:putative membrane protein
VNLPARSARWWTLLAWAAFFVMLWATGETSRYLGPRTDWVVPFGAVALVAVAVAYAGPALRGGGRPLSVREAVGLLAVLTPILVVLVAPQAELGALAASRKSVSRAVTFEKPTGGPVSFAQIDYARYSAVPHELGIVPGRKVELLGFVARIDAPPEMFELGRFYITCCAADALPTLVKIDPSAVGDASEYETDSWQQVAGRIERRNGEFIVSAESIEPAEAPENPYLYVSE